MADSAVLHKESGTDPPLYEPLYETLGEVVEPASKADYSSLTISTIQSESTYGVESGEVTTTRKKTNITKIIMKYKRAIAYGLIISAGVAALAAVFIALFVEIARLKKAPKPSLENTQFPVQLPSDVPLQLDHINNSLSSLRDTNRALHMVLTQFRQDIDSIGLKAQVLSHSLPVSSCAEIRYIFPTGHYWVKAFNGSAVRVYCDMTMSCGGVTGGWMRVAELDMKNSSHQCPNGLRQRTDSSNGTNFRTCVMNISSDSYGFSSVFFDSQNIRYSKVCGKITGYQIGTPNGFGNNAGRRQNRSDINIAYMDGVSLTHGNPRQHIWTFAAALDIFGGGNGKSGCLCRNPNSKSLPNFLKRKDYFCDTGTEVYHVGDLSRFYPDPLWDGCGCNTTDTCCTFFDNPPWFYKQLPQPTTDDIEMRVCRDEEESNENVAIENVELYFQ